MKADLRTSERENQDAPRREPRGRLPYQQTGAARLEIVGIRKANGGRVPQHLEPHGDLRRDDGSVVVREARGGNAFHGDERFAARVAHSGADANAVTFAHNAHEGAGEQGFFSPTSWWPLTLCLALACAFLGVAIGWWLVFFAIPFGAFGVYGFVFEYYRGENKHY